MKTTLLLACDDKYSRYATVTALSGWKWGSEVFEKVLIYGVGLSRLNSRLLSRTLKSNGVPFELRDFDPTYLLNLPTHGHLSPTTHARVFAPDLELGLSHFLYVDSDTLFVGPVDELSELVRVVSDRGNDASLLWARPASEDRTEALVAESHDVKKYFNAGVLFINAGRWRNQGATAEYLRILGKFSSRLEFKNQDTLNILARDWATLPSGYNVMRPVRDGSEKIVHFVGGRSKPWHFGSDHPYTLDYRGLERVSLFPGIYFTGFLDWLAFRLFRMRVKALKKQLRKFGRRISRYIKSF